MKKYIALGVLIGVLLAVGVGLGASVVLAQGPTPQTPTLEQMKTMHEAMHGAGTWDAMVQQMEQLHGKDWFNQMHGRNDMMNGMMNGNWQNHMGNGNFGPMMNGMMRGWGNTRHEVASAST